MRAYQVFASMAPERAAAVLGVLAEAAPGAYTSALAAASAAMKARPRFLARQPAPKRAEAVRRCLSRVAANDLAGEILATYFLDCRKELLVEWLDALGLEHEEGVLEADAPAEPPAEEIRKRVESFLEGEGREDRELLLRAFAAQEAVDWPALEEALGSS